MITSAYAERLTMLFVGDVLLARGVEKTMQERGYDYPFKKLHGLTAQADLSIANLECPISSTGTAKIKKYCLLAMVLMYCILI